MAFLENLMIYEKFLKRARGSSVSDDIEEVIIELIKKGSSSSGAS